MREAVLATVAAVTLAATSLAAGAGAATAVTHGPVRAIPGRVDPTWIGCPEGSAVTASTCLLVGDTFSTQVFGPVVHGGPQGTTTSDGAVASACESATTCVVGGSSASHQGTLVWITGGHVAKTVQVRGMSYVQDVACTATSCVAVGELYGTTTGGTTPTYGAVAQVTEAASSPSARRVTGVAAMYGVACVSATTCYAVGATQQGTSGRGVVVTVANGVPGGPRPASGTDALSHISCGSATTCWATGTSFSTKGGVTTAIVSAVAGKPGGRRSGPEIGGAIACVSATTCLFGTATATYGKGQLDELVNGAVAHAFVISGFGYGALTGLACPTATSCVAVGATAFHYLKHANPYYTGGVVTITV